MTDTTATATGLDALVARLERAADAYIKGDLAAYCELIPHGADYTLMPPYGGQTRTGFSLTQERIDETARFFRNGEATLEVQATYGGRDLAVVVAVERQHGEVGGLPDQDWSLRVTLVFRRVQGAPAGQEWEMVHRHADALVHPISHDQLSALAKGTVS